LETRNKNYIRIWQIRTVVTLLSSWEALVNRLKQKRQTETALAACSDAMQAVAEKYELLSESVNVPPQEGLDGRIAQLELKKLEYVGLHLTKLGLGVGIVCDVAEILHMWRADLLVLTATTRNQTQRNFNPQFFNLQSAEQQAQCEG
jgi:hypothetical protein